MLLPRRAGWFVVLLIALFLNASAYASQREYDAFTTPQELGRIPGHVLPALAKAKKLAPLRDESNQRLTLTIVLKPDDEAGFEAYLREVYDPSSENFHHFLSAHEIDTRFGPSENSYEPLRDYLTAHNLKLVRDSSDHQTISVTGTRADIEAAFTLQIADFQIGQRRFYANQSDPLLPAKLAARVAAVIGLNNLAQPAHGDVNHPWLSLAPSIGDGLNISIAVIAAIVGVAEFPFEVALIIFLAVIIFIMGLFVLLGGLNDESSMSSSTKSNAIPVAPPLGAGQTIGLVEFDTFETSDVSNYLGLIAQTAKLFGLSSAFVGNLANLSVVEVSGGATPGASQSEVLLDIDDVMTATPGAKVAVYDAPFSGGGSYQAVLNAMINGGVNIISNSWAYCEDQTTLADVQSIDMLLQKAALAGITVLSGSGDTGSTCLDGSANTISVPADSPNLTAVGGSSLIVGPGLTYGSETWWNGVNASPPSGQGGFGASKFFARPTYQNGLTGSSMRSIPDVVTNADPATQGMLICQAANGGCPNGLVYGGTSMATPTWAAYVAALNQRLGHKLGFLNPLIYPFANTAAFHNATSMASDFSHVGLGSPSLGALLLDLSGQSPGPVSADDSSVSAFVSPNSVTPNLGGVPADGSTQALVKVVLADSNLNKISGKTVSLKASGGSHAVISPKSAVSNPTNGSAIFFVTDDTPESVTFTGTDTSDGITITQQATIAFVTPAATSASIGAAPNNVNNDGTATSTITVTLKDSLGRPAPGKQVNLTQTGSSAIKGPSPQITDADGVIQFAASDIASESVTYHAIDVTDGNLPVPGSATVTFGGSPSNACAAPNPPAAPGFVFTPYATGFNAQNVSAGGVNFGCSGATGLGFDADGNLYVNDFPLGNIYKFPPGGGVAGAGTQLNASSLGVTLAGLAFDKSGHLFASLDVTNGNFTTGAVRQINPANGSVLATTASNLTCPTTISIDPLSGDLFTDDTCTGSGSDSPDIWRVRNPAGSPSTSVYAHTNVTPNATLAFAPSGTIYLWNSAQVAKVSGTNVPGKPTVSVIPGINVSSLGMIASGQQSNGDATSLIETPFQTPSGAQLGIKNMDLTTTPPSIGTSFSTGSGFNFMTFGPDGCLYGSLQTTVYRITDSTGGCDYGSKLDAPTLVLSPTSVAPNPAQGTSQSFTATLHYTDAPDGTPIQLNVAGANPTIVQAKTVGGIASLSYLGNFPGLDNLGAIATVNKTQLASNQSSLTWDPGKHTTFVGLNQSPQSAMPGQTVKLIASLTDVSVIPAEPLSAETVNFGVGGSTCHGTTNTKGIATCGVTPSTRGPSTLSATFAGNESLLPASNAESFNVVVPPSPIPTATPTATPSPTATATATPTTIPTATPTAAPTPGGNAKLIDHASGGGKPGDTVALGSFGYSASDGHQQTVISVHASVSRPKILSSLTLTAALDNSQVGSTTVRGSAINESTVFTFSPPITLPAGQGKSLTFALSGTIAGAQAQAVNSNVQLAGIGFGPPAGSNSDHSLPMALMFLGFAMMLMEERKRRRAIALAAMTLMLATAIAACSGSSGGAPTPKASNQKVVAMEVTEDRSPVSIAGLPINLGSIHKK